MKRRPRNDPEPADPDYMDQRAGDLAVGSYSHSWLYDEDRVLPEKSQPFGFSVPREKP